MHQTLLTRILFGVCLCFLLFEVASGARRNPRIRNEEDFLHGSCESKIRQCKQPLDRIAVPQMRCADVINATTCVREAVANNCPQKGEHVDRQLFLSNYARMFTRVACFEDDNPVLLLPQYAWFRKQASQISTVTKKCAREFLGKVVAMNGGESEKEICCGHVVFLRCIVNTERKMYSTRRADNIVDKAYKIFSHMAQAHDSGMQGCVEAQKVLHCDPQNPPAYGNTEERYV